MTIWILALLMFAAFVLIGFSQGAIRVGISFLGIIVAALLAVPLSGLLRPVLAALGVSNPILLWTLPAFIVFCIINILVKVAALAVHKNVDVHYRYHAGELRLALWERLNKRLGACLGLLNATAYLILIGFVIHSVSYWTVQIAETEGNSRIALIANQMGRDLQATRFAKAAMAVGSLPDSYYDAADLAGRLIHNPLLEARLARYPGLLSLSERTEFLTLGSDTTFSDLRLKQKPLGELLAHPTVQPIYSNPETLRTVWNTLLPDLKDLYAYLDTGKSAKYDSQEILGRWAFDATASTQAYRRDHASLPTTEVTKIRNFLRSKFDKTTLMAAPDKMAVLKNMPQLKITPGQPPSTDLRNFQGNWRDDAAGYAFSFPGEEERKATLLNGKLTFKIEGYPVVFSREE